jgi:phage major head subunit gpT-like protein
LSTSKIFRAKTGKETDREIKLLDTIKALKGENKQIYQLYKEQEKNLNSKIKESRKEMEKMTTIINQLWPFIQSHLKREIGSSKIANLK